MFAVCEHAVGTAGMRWLGPAVVLSLGQGRVARRLPGGVTWKISAGCCKRRRGSGGLASRIPQSATGPRGGRGRA